jgi:hypothetical protein
MLGEYSWDFCHSIAFFTVKDNMSANTAEKPKAYGKDL